MNPCLLGFFSTDPAKVLAALHKLSEVSVGAVLRPELVDAHGRAGRDGLCCARLFGPFVDDTCTCGRIQADPSLRGTECEHCGVTIGPATLRDHRWAHVDLPGPVEHPAGISVRRVPVPPPGLRPLRHVSAPAAGRLAPPVACVPGPDMVAFQSLVHRVLRWVRLLEIDAPEVIVDMEARAVQACLYDVVHRFSLPQDHPERSADGASLWKQSEEVPPTPLRLRGAPELEPPDAFDGPPHPIAVAFADEAHVLVQWPDRLDLLALSTGRVVRQWPVAGPVLRGVWHGHALLSHPYGQSRDDAAVWGVAVLDLSTGQWCTEPPPDMPVVTVNKAQPEDAWLEDWHSGCTAPVFEDCSGDRAAEVARSPDLQFVWVSSMLEDGAIQSLRTAEPHLLVSRLRLHDQCPPERDPYDEDLGVHPAFARGPRRLWHILDTHGGVSIDGIVRFFVPADTCVGAFSADAARLVVVGASRLCVLAVPSGAVVVGPHAV